MRAPECCRNEQLADSGPTGFSQGLAIDRRLWLATVALGTMKAKVAIIPGRCVYHHLLGEQHVRSALRAGGLEAAAAFPRLGAETGRP